jgi:lysophospholipid acyltransferase (LPLAT)-like uncharacterized protein
MKKFLAALSAFLIHSVALSLRISRVDRGGIFKRPGRPPAILVFWHNRLFLMGPFYYRFCREHAALAFISRSRDGQFVSDIVSWFKIDSARGSSSRNGVSAAMTAIRAAKNDELDLVLTPDGPRGPRYRVQPGVLWLARSTGRPIVTVTTNVRWKWVLKSWDKFQVPIPFSRCELVSGEPIYVPPEATDEEMAEIGARVAGSLGGD